MDRKPHMTRLNIYRYTFKATCPVDKANIEYRLQIETDGVIKAESIVAACVFDQPVFHEDVADRLFEGLGGDQVLTATHTGVEIETRRRSNA